MKITFERTESNINSENTSHSIEINKDDADQGEWLNLLNCITRLYMGYNIEVVYQEIKDE